MNSSTFRAIVRLHLYVELGLLVEGFTVVSLTAEMIDAVINVIVVFIAVLRRCLIAMNSGVKRWVIGAAVMLVLDKVGI